MDSKTLASFHRFGKIGKIIVMALAVLAILATVVSLVATIYVSALPKDALVVRVTNHAEFQINEQNFDSLWGFLVDGFSYADETGPGEMLNGEKMLNGGEAPSDGGAAAVPPENQDFQANLSFFNQSYSSAKIHTDGNKKVIEADSAPAEYRSSSLASVLVALTLSLASAAVALLMLERLFAVLAKSETPFCDALVKKMKTFGFSLLAVALFATAGETLSAAFLSAGKESGLQIQWGILVAFAVVMCLVVVFRYGVQLQKESDETL